MNNQQVTVASNSGNLVKTNCIFSGWNTQADGNGTDYSAGSGIFNITENTTLYAKWISVPEAPTAPTISEGNTTLGVSWSAPNSGGSEVTGYNIYVDGTKNNTSIITGTNYTIEGLTNGTSYSVKVSALNAVGEGSQSSESIAKAGLISNKPVVESITSGKGELTVVWNAPNDNGSDPILGYNIYVDSLKVNENLISETEIMLSGFVNGQLYNIQITAVNIVGESIKTDAATGMPKAEPSIPSNIRAAFLQLIFFITKIIHFELYCLDYIYIDHHFLLSFSNNLSAASGPWDPGK